MKFVAAPTTVLTAILLALPILTATAVGADISADGAKRAGEIIAGIDSNISWPDDKSFEGNGDLLVITAIGKSALFDELKKYNGKKTDEGREIKFRVVDPDWMPANSHIVIFSGLDAQRTQKLIGLLVNRGSLTITLGEGNSSWGSALNFVDIPSNVQTELNLKVTKREGFTVAPSFIELAEVVDE